MKTTSGSWSNFKSGYDGYYYIVSEEYNGGYEFTSYQWYLNGSSLDGFTTSQFYVENQNLDFNGEYRVLLTRVENGDSISMMTCGLTPIEFTDEQLNEVGTLIFTQDKINIDTPQKAKGYIYNISGLIYSMFDLEEGVNQVDMPTESGVYIIRLEYGIGEVELVKIVVGR